MALNLLTIPAEIRTMVLQHLYYPESKSMYFSNLQPNHFMSFWRPQPNYFTDFMVVSRVCRQLRAEIIAFFPKNAPLYLDLGINSFFQTPHGVGALRPLKQIPSTNRNGVRQLFVHGLCDLEWLLHHVLPIVPNVECVRVASDEWELTKEAHLMDPDGTWSIAAVEQSGVEEIKLVEDHVHRRYETLKSWKQVHCWDHVKLRVEKPLGHFAVNINGPSDEDLSLMKAPRWYDGETFQIEHWIAAYVRPNLEGNVMTVAAEDEGEGGYKISREYCINFLKLQDALANGHFVRKLRLEGDFVYDPDRCVIPTCKLGWVSP